MQIPHRNVVTALTGFALGIGIGIGIGSTVMLQKVLEKGLGQQKTSRDRPHPTLTSPLLLQGEPALGAPSARLHRGIQ